MTLDPSALACALGGDASSRSVLAPGPGHSRVDYSLCAAPDGFILHSFADDLPLEGRDYVRAALGVGAQERLQLLAGELAARATARGTHTCECCGKCSEPRRKNSKFDGGSCKKHAYRQRVTDHRSPLRPESETPNVTSNGSEAARRDKSRNGRAA
jgi:hypothetical protein